MSYSYLSGLENEKHSVSIANLSRIAAFFKVDMVHFLIPSGPAPRVFRKQELFKPANRFENIAYHVLTPSEAANLQVSYVHLPPNEPQERNIHKHGKGQEMVLVLEGTAHVMVEDEKYQLGPGDNIIFEAQMEHLIYTEDEAATIMIITSPPFGQNVLINQ